MILHVERIVDGGRELCYAFEIDTAPGRAVMDGYFMNPRPRGLLQPHRWGRTFIFESRGQRDTVLEEKSSGYDSGIEF